MNDERLRTLYEKSVSRRSRPSRATCVAPERMREIVVRSGPEDQRLAWLDHIMDCPDCSREFELLRAVSAAEHRTQRPWMPYRGWAVAATVALLVGAGLIWQVQLGERGLTRGPAEDRLIEPRGRVIFGEPLTLTWHRVDDALRYRAEVLDPDGRVVFAAATKDTVLLVPDSTTFVSGSEYSWRLQRVGTDGVTVDLGAIHFVVREP